METELTNSAVEKHEEAIMDALTNICALLHMFDGWVDSTFPYSSVIHAHDKRIMAQMIQTRGQAKILLKLLSKQLVKDDDKAIDYMFENLGRQLSKACKMSIEERNVWMEKINSLDLDFKE